MTREQRDRCEELANRLEKLPPDQCYMGTWVKAGGSQLPEKGKRMTAGCDTTACIAGWAAILFTPVLTASAEAVYNRTDMKELKALGIDVDSWCVEEDPEPVVRIPTEHVAGALLGERVNFYGGGYSHVEDKRWMIDHLRNVVTNFDEEAARGQ